MLAFGAGAEMRQSLGTAVFSGTVGVTLFGLIFTPVFYVLCRGLPALGQRFRRKPTDPDAGSVAADTPRAPDTTPVGPDPAAS